MAIAWLYYFCFLLLAILMIGIAIGSRRRPRRRARLRCRFFGLALCLVLWQLTLFGEVRTANQAAQLGLGRLNFTVMAVAPWGALRFVQTIARQDGPIGRWWIAETALVAALTLLTPLVDAAERVEAGVALTTFGPLFPLYVVHVIGYWVAALVVSWRERRRATNSVVRDQLALIGGGILTTGAVALLTNVLLPYGFGDFRWCEVGALSTLLFLLSVVAAATLREGELLFR